jgi:hypothetical protein
VAPSLNGADPSFMNSVTGSTCREQSAQISYMIVKKFCSIGPRTFCLFCLQQRWWDIKIRISRDSKIKLTNGPPQTKQKQEENVNYYSVFLHLRLDGVQYFYLSLTDFERRAKKTCKNCRTFLFEKKVFWNFWRRKVLLTVLTQSKPCACNI